METGTTRPDGADRATLALAMLTTACAALAVRGSFAFRTTRRWEAGVDAPDVGAMAHQEGALRWAA